MRENTPWSVEGVWEEKGKRAGNRSGKLGQQPSGRGKGQELK